MLTTAVTLNAHGVTDIQTSAQAAEALRPVAGDFAFYLFSAGLIGTGNARDSVLAGSAAYAVAETFKWRSGLSLKPIEGRGFYGIIAGGHHAGRRARLHAHRSDQSLVLERSDKRRAGRADHGDHDADGRAAARDGAFVVRRELKVLGWFATGVMALAVCTMLVTLFI
jgi:Mn2+/Fe2+ NRAMP family transporter